MTVLYLLLFVVAFVLFLLETFNVMASRFSLVALGLACIALVHVLQTLHRV